jgi:hypothetical protein
MGAVNDEAGRVNPGVNVTPIILFQPMTVLACEILNKVILP